MTNLLGSGERVTTDDFGPASILSIASIQSILSMAPRTTEWTGWTYTDEHRQLDVAAIPGLCGLKTATTETAIKALLKLCARRDETPVSPREIAAAVGEDAVLKKGTGHRIQLPARKYQ